MHLKDLSPVVSFFCLADFKSILKKKKTVELYSRATRHYHEVFQSFYDLRVENWDVTQTKTFSTPFSQ